MQSQSPASPQSDLLFQEDDLIRSVLDLTRQLAALGIIEVYLQPSGAEFYRIVAPRKSRFGARQNASGELARRVGAIFGRKANSLWAKDEIEAFKAIKDFDLDELALVETYYRSEAKKENSYCRTALLTFLRHYPGEVDRARRWKQNFSRRHCY
jgi:hypothetical protein